MVDDSAEVEDGVHYISSTVKFWMWPGPHYHHSITVEDEHCIKHAADRKALKTWTEKQTEKAYVWDGASMNGEVRPGGACWSTYRHSLEQVVNRIKTRPESAAWIDADESIK